MTTRGLVEHDCIQIVDLIDRVLMNHDNDSIIREVQLEVNRWMKEFPLYAGIMA
jgi:glycine hydroxymethyltransferase